VAACRLLTAEVLLSPRRIYGGQSRPGPGFSTSSVNIIPPWLFKLIYHLVGGQFARWWLQFRDMVSPHRHEQVPRRESRQRLDCYTGILECQRVSYFHQPFNCFCRVCSLPLCLFSVFCGLNTGGRLAFWDIAPCSVVRFRGLPQYVYIVRQFKKLSCSTFYLSSRCRKVTTSISLDKYTAHTVLSTSDRFLYNTSKGPYVTEKFVKNKNKELHFF
jgi:hypothetical protein